MTNIKHFEFQVKFPPCVKVLSYNWQWLKTEMDTSTVADIVTRRDIWSTSFFLFTSLSTCTRSWRCKWYFTKRVRSDFNSEFYCPNYLHFCLFSSIYCFYCQHDIKAPDEDWKARTKRWLQPEAIHRWRDSQKFYLRHMQECAQECCTDSAVKWPKKGMPRLLQR